MRKAFDAEISKKELTTRRAFSAEINFFGKVVDEHGAPIPKAITSYIVSGGKLSDNPTQPGPMTDSGGRFSIIGQRGG